jgi:peptidoglycan/LPS O-acetylase OafA/YrhL
MNAEVTPFDRRIVRPLMPELDTIRGIAVLVVFWYHGFMLFTPASSGAPEWERIFVALSRQGWAGVNLFFVLSGFLITGILLDSASKPNYYSRFYYRRALRILPAYYLLLLMLIVLGHISFMPRHTSLAFVGLSFIYLSNITPLLGIPLEYGPLWSLAVEEHFYILWPAAVRTLTRRNLTIVAASICVLEPFIRIYSVHRGGLWWSTYTWVSADGLALGGLLAIFGRSSLASRANLLKLVLLAAVSAIAGMAASTVVPRSVQVGIRGTCVNYFAFATVGAIVWLGTGAYRGLVNIRFLSFVGYISYGLYLIHMLCLDLYNGAAQQFFPSLSVGTSFPKSCLRLLIALTVATAIAYVSRVTYEEFFLRMKDKRLKARETVEAPAF